MHKPSMIPHNFIPSQLCKPCKPLPILTFQLLNVLIPRHIFEFLQFGFINSTDPVAFAKFPESDRARKSQHNGWRWRCTDGSRCSCDGMKRSGHSWNQLLLLLLQNELCEHWICNSKLEKKVVCSRSDGS